MLNSKSFITVDFGAGTLKLAEFEINDRGGLQLRQYGLKSLGEEGAKEESREKVLQEALQSLLTEKGLRSKNVNVCAPGYHVFSKFVKLPPVEASKVTQIIQYEAQQNVPFPLSEVVWDYQILGTTATGELEVLLVAIKSDIVERLFAVTEASGLRLQLADVSPAALCNAFRYNYSHLEDCSMLLDIGAKTSNLLFFEKGKVYSRSINLGANSITQDFKNEAKLSWADAESKKISEGFVSLGGAYEEPENPHQAAISKIARQFMTRLHIQVNQTMQFYRGQQGGAAPVRLFLSGGASLMPYTAQFFAEKLSVPVEYFNPFSEISLDESINKQELQGVAHSLGEVVGLGLRNLANCPVELNLMPESTLNWVQFNQKKPWLIATGLTLALVVFLFSFVFSKLAAINQEELTKLSADIKPEQEKEVRFKKAVDDRNKAKAEADQLADWINQRYYWAEVLSEVHKDLIDVEATTGDLLHAQTGVWIEKFVSYQPETDISSGQGGNPQPNRMPRNMRPGVDGPGMVPAPQAPVAPAPGQSSTTEITMVTILFRGVDLTKTTVPDANTKIYYEVAKALQNSPMFDKDQTQLAGDYNPDPNGTFTFGVNVKLKRPLKL